MDFAAVAEHDDIRDTFARDKLDVPTRKLGKLPAVIQGGFCPIRIEPVAAAEVDAKRSMTVLDEHVCEPAEES
ncbi:hypothetical protein [Burkholderia gladioli]|uniref:hypothetical protein n=1 Tax=Burkholderia gladioli TaxID=28095 RepID=UPI0034DB19BD